MDFPSAPKTYGVFRESLSEYDAAKIEAGGNSLVWLPAMEAVPLDITSAVGEIARIRSGTDWLVFADPAAADVFCSRAESAQIDLSVLDELHICAVGEATALRLRSSYIHTDILTGRFPEAVVEVEIGKFVGTLEHPRLFIINEKTDRLFTQSRFGWEIEEIPVYWANVDKSEAGKAKALMTGEAIDRLLFSAPEDLIALRVILQPAPVRKALESIEIWAANGQVYQALREHGLQPAKMLTL